MKIYFYGATLKAAEKKGNTFVAALKRAGEKLLKEKNTIINITRINDTAEADIHCIIQAYKFRVLVEYSIMTKEAIKTKRR